MDYIYSPPGSSVHGISKARVLEWVAIPFSKGSFWSRKWTHISCVGRQILYPWATRDLPFTLIKYLFCTKCCHSSHPRHPQLLTLHVHGDLTLEIWFPFLFPPLSSYCLWQRWKLQLIIKTPLGKHFHWNSGFSWDSSIRNFSSFHFWVHGGWGMYVFDPFLCQMFVVTRGNPSLHMRNNCEGIFSSTC